MSETRGREFIGYEYQDVTVKSNMEHVYADGYPNFGWDLEGTSFSLSSIGSVVMKFKRDRKIRNKAELTRLQRQFDACVAEIHSMEISKTLMASVAAYIVGVIGTAFMAGSVFAITGGNTTLCIILAVPAFVGWVLPYFLFKVLSRKKSTAVMPKIDQKYDELYDVTEKANALLAH